MLNPLGVYVKKTKNKQPKEETVDDIQPYWVIMEGWEELSYEDKARYYWEYKFVDGKRVMTNGN